MFFFRHITFFHYVLEGVSAGGGVFTPFYLLFVSDARMYPQWPTPMWVPPAHEALVPPGRRIATWLWVYVETI